MNNWIISIALSVGVLGFVPGLLPFRANKTFVSEWSIISAIALLMIKDNWLKAFLIWCVITTIMHLNQFSTLTLHTVALFLVFYTIIEQKADKDKIFDAIAVIGIIQALAVITQWLGLWISIVPKNLHTCGYINIGWKLFPILVMNKFGSFHNFGITGLMDQINTSSGLLVLCLPVFFKYGWKKFIPLIILALFISYSLGGIIPAMVIIGYYLFKRFKFDPVVITCCIGILLISYILKYDNFYDLMTGTKRFKVWEIAITKLFPIHWISGWGLGQSVGLGKLFQSLGVQDRFLHPHSEFINVILEQGIIGFMLIFGFLVSKIKYMHKDMILFMGLIVGMLNMAVSFNMHLVPGIILLTYLALGRKNEVLTV